MPNTTLPATECNACHRSSENYVFRLSMTVEALVQEFLQRNSIIVLRIMRTVDQRDVAEACSFRDGPPRTWISFEFDKVTPAELVPTHRIVVKPFPQTGAWGRILQPCFDFQRRFFMPRGHRRSTRKRLRLRCWMSRKHAGAESLHILLRVRTHLHKMGCEKVLRGQFLPCRKSKGCDIHILVLLQDIAQGVLFRQRDLFSIYCATRRA